MATRPPVAGAVQRHLGPVAERAARATGLVRRAAKLTGTRFVQTPACGWLAQPEARLSQSAQPTATLGGPRSPHGPAGRCGVASAAGLREVREAAVQRPRHHRGCTATAAQGLAAGRPEILPPTRSPPSP